MLSLILALGLQAPDSPTSLQPLQGGPIDFVCDSMQVFTKPDHIVCRNNVLVRRGDLLLCCNTIEAYTDAQGGWQRFTCIDNVRAQRGGELMWAQKATFIVSLADLILTGRPRVRRGKSILEGERIVIDTRYDRAHVERPRGTMQAASEEGGALPITELPLKGDLPHNCPIPGPPAE